MNVFFWKNCLNFFVKLETELLYLSILQLDDFVKYVQQLPQVYLETCWRRGCSSTQILFFVSIVVEITSWPLTVSPLVLATFETDRCMLCRHTHVHCGERRPIGGLSGAEHRKKWFIIEVVVWWECMLLSRCRLRMLSLRCFADEAEGPWSNFRMQLPSQLHNASTMTAFTGGKPID